MTRSILITGLIFLIINVYGQLPTGGYYRLDSLSINKNDKNELTYTEISKDSKSIFYAVFQIVYIMQPDSVPVYKTFNIKSNSYSLSCKGKIRKKGNYYTANLKLTNGIRTNIKIKKKIILEVDNDKNLIIDHKLFKPDVGLKVFKKYTGY